MANLSKLELLINLGFKEDPFKSTVFETGDSIRIGRIMDMAVKSNAMVSIVGERGAGKSQAVNAALKGMNVRSVMVRSADKSKLLISDIEQAMIIDLSEENPKRGREIRARQLRRVLGEASRKQKVVVIIEEGHRLHGMTLRALKTLREMDWMGETELFSVVLLGQSDPMNKAGVAEVRLRSDSVHMHGLTASEIAGYVTSTVGSVFDETAAEAIGREPKARNFLDLQGMLVTLMSHAVSCGHRQITGKDVAEVFVQDTAKPARRNNSRSKPSTGLAPDSEHGKRKSTALQSVLDRRKGIDATTGMQKAV